MPKRRNQKRQTNHRFIMITYPMLESYAYRSLSTHACRLLTEIQYRFNGSNNGDISLSCREAAEALHCGTTTAGKAFEELTKKGFIKCTVDSSFNYKTKRARRFALTFEDLGNSPPTHEWKKITVHSEKVTGPDSVL